MTNVDYLTLTVKIVSIIPEKKSIIMCEIKGKLVDELIKTKNEHLKHMGKWLALFHNQTIDKNKKVIVFGDFSRMNFIIDEKLSTATALDPGEFLGKRDYPERDLNIALLSIVIGSLRNYKNPKENCYNFLNGYWSLSTEKINYTNFKRTFIIILSEFKYKSSKNMVLLKPFTIGFSYLYQFYINLIVKKYLKGKS